MSQYNYIEIIGECFPDAIAEVPTTGDFYTYEDVVWTTTPIAKSVLEQCYNDGAGAVEVGSPGEVIPKVEKVFSAYNGSVIQTFSNNSIVAKFGSLDMTDYTYDYSNGSVTVKETGWYNLFAKVVVQCTSLNIKTAVTGGLYKDGDIIPGTRCDQWFRNEGMLVSKKLVYLYKDEVIEFRMNRTYGNKTVRTVVDGSQIMIEYRDQ